MQARLQIWLGPGKYIYIYYQADDESYVSFVLWKSALYSHMVVSILVLNC